MPIIAHVVRWHKSRTQRAPSPPLLPLRFDKHTKRAHCVRVSSTLYIVHKGAAAAHSIDNGWRIARERVRRVERGCSLNSVCSQSCANQFVARRTLHRARKYGWSVVKTSKNFSNAISFINSLVGSMLLVYMASAGQQNSARGCIKSTYTARDSRWVNAFSALRAILSSVGCALCSGWEEDWITAGVTRARIHIRHMCWTCVVLLWLEEIATSRWNMCAKANLTRISGFKYRLTG